MFRVLFLALTLLLPVQSWAAAAFVQSNACNASGASTTITCTLNGITAANLIIMQVKWEDSSNTLTSVSDGTTTFGQTAVCSRAGANSPFTAWAYLLNANSGNKTFTATIPTGSTFRVITVMEFSGGTWSTDATAACGTAESGTAVSSGNITTVGTDGVAVGSYAPNSGVSISAWAINGVTADGHREEDFASMWYKTYTAGYTGAATATLGGSQNWVSGAMAFKVTAGGGGPDVTPFYKRRIQ